MLISIGDDTSADRDTERVLMSIGNDASSSDENEGLHPTFDMTLLRGWVFSRQLSVNS